jgi:hypothetical protein
MCMGSSAPKPKAPAPPPPPPPVLEQNAPDTAAATATDTVRKKASGSKPYRTSLGITAPNNDAAVRSNNLNVG